jgi:hypothetical protein
LQQIENHFLATVEGASNDERELIKEQIRYLEEASQRLGRKDWFLVLIGVLVNITVAAMFSPDKVREFWNMVQTFFGPLVRSVLNLPHA